MPMRFTRVFFILGLFLIPFFANPANISNEDSIQHRMNLFMKKNHIKGAAVLIADHGKIKTYLFGESVPEKHIPVTENTLFELGSITKTFTDLLLAEEILKGKINFSDRIQNDFDTHSLPTLKKVTYLNLATYTSGLPFNIDGLFYNAASSLKNQNKLYAYLQNSAPIFKPGSHMLYSNVGFGILGQALAQKEETPLPQLMTDNILSPLKMNNSGLEISHENQKYLAQGYTAEGKPTHILPSGLMGGAWAMKASPHDMQSYLKAVLGERSMPKKIHEAILLTETAYYDMPSEGMQIGLGWFVTPLNKRSMYKLIHQPDHYQFIPYRVKAIKNPAFNAHTLIGKTGATDGFRAYIAVIPEKHIGIVMMINRFIPSSGALANLGNTILLERTALE